MNSPHPKLALPPGPIHTVAIDDVAFASLRTAAEERSSASLLCDLCGAPIVHAPVASGLLLWSRQGDVQADEPPLCAECAASIATLAFAAWRGDEEADE